ncbi:hypothetical protein TNCV_2361501 [Trichonephila clavipes]|nr:hypothetical protein TNCV_2361501 [Trichonephila clavipes]
MNKDFCEFFWQQVREYLEAQVPTSNLHCGAWYSTDMVPHLKVMTTTGECIRSAMVDT